MSSKPDFFNKDIIVFKAMIETPIGATPIIKLGDTSFREKL